MVGFIIKVEEHFQKKAWQHLLHHIAICEVDVHLGLPWCPKNTSFRYFMQQSQPYAQQPNWIQIHSYVTIGFGLNSLLDSCVTC